MLLYSPTERELLPTDIAGDAYVREVLHRASQGAVTVITPDDEPPGHVCSFSDEGSMTLDLQGVFGYHINCNECVADIRNAYRNDGITAINVNITSPGGILRDGVAIYSALREAAREGVTIGTHVSSYAMSAATIVLAAGDRRTSEEAAEIMVHAPWVFVYAMPNRVEMRDLARRVENMLRSAENTMRPTYRRAGVSATRVREYLNGDDHFLAPSEALEDGLITEVLDDEGNALETSSPGAGEELEPEAPPSDGEEATSSVSTRYGDFTYAA